MLAPWIRRALAVPARPARRPALTVAPLEVRCVPAAWQMGSTGFDTAAAVAADAAGNVYVSGTFNATVDFDPGPGTATLTAAGAANTSDAFLAKYTAAGALVW